MKTLAFAIAAVMAASPAGEPGPSELVGLLASAGRVEREEAARTLEELGAEALPALQLAEKSGPEAVRARAKAIARSIEGRLLDRPTPVALDFDGQPLAGAIRTLAARSGHDLSLDPGGDAALPGRPIRARSPAPVPFWEALDRVGRAGHVRHDPAAKVWDGTRAPLLHLVDGEPPAWTLYRGPFRVHLLGLHRRRDQDFGGRGPTAPGVLYVDVQAFAEPGRSLELDGMPRLEATDDLGRPAPAPPVDAEWPRPHPMFWRVPGALGVLQWRLPLGPPDGQASALRTLRGTLPVVVSAPKGDPLVVPLDEAHDKSYRHEGATLRSHIVQDTGKNGLQVEAFLGPDPASADDSSAPMPGPLATRFTFEDRYGRPLSWLPLSQDAMPDSEVRVRMMVADGERPIRLLHHGLIRAATEIPFEFADVPLP